jgi:hypothetical protein
MTWLASVLANRLNRYFKPCLGFKESFASKSGYGGFPHAADG